MSCRDLLALQTGSGLFRELRKLLIFPDGLRNESESVLLASAARHRSWLRANHRALVFGLPVGKLKTGGGRNSRETVPVELCQCDGSGPSPGATSREYCADCRRGSRSATLTGSQPTKLHCGLRLTVARRFETAQWSDGLPRLTRARSQSDWISRTRPVSVTRLGEDRV